MADEKLTALAATTGAVGTDLVYVVTDPGTTPASKKSTLANIRAAVLPTGAAAGAVLAMGNSAVIWNAGTSFPGSKATGDRYWRTDLSLEFFWDGTRWLTTVEYTFPWNAIALITGMSASGAIATGSTDSTLDPYVTTAVFATYVSTTNNGSNYWTVNINKAPPTGASTSIGSANTSADAADTTVVHTVTINATFARASYPQITFSCTKTSSPGNLYPTALLKYRLIGT